MGKPALIPQEAVASRFYSEFHLLVGRGKQNSTSSVSAATGICQRTVEAHHQGESVPNLANFLCYAAVLPDTFLNGLISVAGKGHASDMDTGEGCHFTVAELGAVFQQRLAQAMRDGHVNEDEERDLKQIARQVRGACDAILNDLETLNAP